MKLASVDRALGLGLFPAGSAANQNTETPP